MRPNASTTTGNPCSNHLTREAAWASRRLGMASSSCSMQSHWGPSGSGCPASPPRTADNLGRGGVGGGSSHPQSVLATGVDANGAAP